MPGQTPGKRIGRNVRAHREAAMYSRADLAKLSGVSASTIEDVELGLSARPRRTTLDRLAKGLGVDVETLMHGGESEVGDIPLVGPAAPSLPEMQAAADDALRYLLAAVEAKLAKPHETIDRDELLFAHAAVTALGWDRVSHLPADLSYRTLAALKGLHDLADDRINFDKEVLNLQRASSEAGRVPGEAG